MGSVAHWILRWPSQSMTRKAYGVPGAGDPFFGVDTDAIDADSFGGTAMLLVVWLGFWDQILEIVE